MLTGHGLEQIDAGTRQVLEQILELFTVITRIGCIPIAL
jgi:hypothetical protein